MIHLHGHSHFSLLDGLNSPEEIVDKTVSLGMSAIAITEHGNINSSFKFYNYAKSKGINPLLGMEAYFVEDWAEKSRGSHVTLLAKNYEGFQNLIELNNLANKHGFYYIPRINLDSLQRLKSQIICMTGCLHGILCKEIVRETKQEKRLLGLFKDLFGEDLYIELQNHGIADQKKVMGPLIKLSKDFGVKCVATNDYHYTDKSEAIYQEMLMADQMGQNLNEQRKIRLEAAEFYIKDHAEMLHAMDNELSYLLNTHEVAEKVKIEFPKFEYLLPNLGSEAFHELEEKSWIELHKQFPNNEEYASRLRMELDVIRDANLVDYFLIVQDYVSWAEKNKIWVGPCRGSVGGSLVGYLIGIHKLDPIQYGLYFSRFYNAGRKGSLPDIDIDFMESRVDEVKEYLHKTYGHVAQIGTFGKLALRGALKLSCRVKEVPFGDANKYSSLVDPKAKTLKDCMANPKFQELYNTDERLRELMKDAQELEGVAHSESIHAAGLFVSPCSLERLVPLRLDRKSGSPIPVCSWDMEDVEKRGLVKLDLLSLNTLDIIADTVKYGATDFSYNIRLDDPQVFYTINSGSWVGIFQLSDSMSKLAQSMGVYSLYDIAVLVALHRPGPLKANLHTLYIQRKKGKKSVKYAHPKLEKVLKDTYGVIIFQEQIISTLIEVGGFSEVEADAVRKIIGKKLLEKGGKEEVEKFRKLGKQFVEGAKKNGLTEQEAQKIWDEIYEFSGYGFNLAHATGYGLLTYFTAWLKTYYPVEFMTSCFNNSVGKPDKIRMFLTECSRMGIKVKPPSVGNSNLNFSRKGNDILYGFNTIKGLMTRTVNSIIEEREKGEFTNFNDFLTRVTPDKGSLLALCESGALDEFDISRKAISENIEDLIEKLKQYHNSQKKALLSLIDNEFDYKFKDNTEYSLKEMLTKEHQRLGAFLSYDPYLEFRDEILERWPQEDMEDIEDSMFGYIAGVVAGKDTFITKKTKATMCTLTIENEYGPIDVFVFPKLYQQLPRKVHIGDVVVFSGNFQREENKLKFIADKFIICLNERN